MTRRTYAIVGIAVCAAVTIAILEGIGHTLSALRAARGDQVMAGAVLALMAVVGFIAWQIDRRERRP